MKFPSLLVAKPTDKPYLAHVTFSWRPEIASYLNPIPGVTRVGKEYIVPIELLPKLARLAGAAGLEFRSFLQVESPPLGESRLHPKLYPHQIEHVRQALAAPRSSDFGTAWLLNDEMGVGKTPSAIEIMRQRNVRSALIVCPALVRLDWLDRLNEWWTDHPKAAVVSIGSAAQKTDEPFVITSYELAKHFIERAFDAIVVDESHYVANGTGPHAAQRSRTVRKTLIRNQRAVRLELTATPISNEPKGLHHQLDILWPGRFGCFWDFVKRYCEIRENLYTKFDIRGLNDEHAEELRERLAAISSRTTKKEIAHLLPAFTVRSLRVPAKRDFNPRELFDKFTRMDLHRNNIGSLIRIAGEQKIEAALELARNAAETQSHVGIFTHHIETAREIAIELGCGVITGEDVPNHARRKQMIADIAAQSKGFLVGTMHSMNVGIDLTFCTTAIAAELSYVPVDIEQLAGRFSRLSGKLPSDFIMLVLEGTHEEYIASMLLRKFADINALIASGQSSEAICAALDPTKPPPGMSEEAWEKQQIAELRRAVLSSRSEAYI